MAIDLEGWIERRREQLKLFAQECPMAEQKLQAFAKIELLDELESFLTYSQPPLQSGQGNSVVQQIIAGEEAIIP